MSDTTVTAKLALRVGADLADEPWDGHDLATTWEIATDLGGVDGGLFLAAPGRAPACRTDLWDQLDGLLLAWLTALDEIADGASEAIVHFPDTRIEALLTAGDEVTVQYEDIDTTLPLDATRAAILSAARRLVAQSAAKTEALRALQRRISGPFDA
ncbi:MAG: hypothetical protein KC502_09675 [Myxococcales bacterium]|nr:hypothetical protein [Myxococcales bacterium]